ncbi:MULTISPECIES: replication protein [unclassified Acinetobacter]|uniref:replication protein n=1 Tax=unclassified Acinetobacter TaxID=196816 RepID=UPI0025C2C5BA|nr:MULTISPECIES: replication protein [unclassified Acinetobacter]
MSQWIPNSFQMPNALVDSGMLAKLKGSSLAMYIFIVRKTRGWQKESDSISLSQFIEFTGYGKDAVLSGADKLVELGLIKRVEYQNQPALYTLNDLPESVTEGESEKPTAEKTHADKTTGGVGKNDSTQSENPTHNNNYKTTNTKTNISKGNQKKSVSEKIENSKADKFDFKSALISNGVSEQTAIEFMQVRKAKGGVNTERAFTLLENQIAKANLTFSQGVEYCLNRQKPWAAFEAQWYFNELNRTTQATPSNQPQTQRRRFGSQASETQMRTVVGGQIQ